MANELDYSVSLSVDEIRRLRARLANNQTNAILIDKLDWVLAKAARDMVPTGDVHVDDCGVGLEELQKRVQESKTARQLSTELVDRALFLTTEAGEVVRTVLEGRAYYGRDAQAKSKERLAEELCDLIWNACDMASLAGVDLEPYMEKLLAKNAARTWDGM